MMVSVREYVVRLVEDKLVVTTVSGSLVNLVVCTVPVGPWIDIEDHRAWHVRETGQQVAFGILFHHLSLRRDGSEAKWAAMYWRGEFASEVLESCIEDHVHVTDVFIDAWLVGRVLDEVRLHYGLIVQMRRPGHTIN